MSRVLWVSNPPWAGSGYGMQTALFTSRLRALGHDVAIGANFGLEGAVFDWHGLTVYPSDRDWSNRAIGTWARHHEAELVIFLCDAWVLRPAQWLEELEEELAGVRLAVWAPVDHNPIPPSVFGVLNHERIAPIAMSKFGARLMGELELEHHYVPHGIDTKRFAPRRSDRDAIRDELGIDRDTFLVGMVAANQGNPSMPRKGFPEAFCAFAQLARAHDDARLYVHTSRQPVSGGIDIETCAILAGIPSSKISFPDAAAFHLGMSDELVSNLYQVFDVLLAPSYGEGFGIPVVEAQACGVPVIVSKGSAQTELCGAGWLVETQPHWDNPSKSWFHMPSIESIRLGLEAAYETRDDLELRARAREFAVPYDATTVTVDYWAPALEALGVTPAVEQLEPESRQVRRARERREAKTQAART